MDSGYIPNSWLNGIDIPICKNKGDPQKKPVNCCSITILSCLGKLFTSIFNKRFTAFLELNDILDENQEGFMHGHS